MFGKREALKAVTPLRLVFWGSMLYIVDYVPAWAKTERWRVDLFSDVVGMVLVAIGASLLWRLPVHQPSNDRYSGLMRMVKYVAIGSAIVAAMEHVVFYHPRALNVFLALFGAVRAVTIVLFGWSVMYICTEAKLARAHKSWTVTMFLLGGILGLPLLYCSYVTFLTLLAPGGLPMDLGWAKPALTIVWAIPLAAVYVSTSHLAKEATEPDNDDAAGPRDMTHKEK